MVLPLTTPQPNFHCEPFNRTPQADDRYAFKCEWYDDVAALVRPYSVLYFPSDNTVEMIDAKAKRTFLRRAPVAAVKLADLFVGATVTILGRQLRVVDYADTFTASKLGARQEHTLVMIKPGFSDHLGPILEALLSLDLKIVRMTMTQLSRTDAQEFYAEHSQRHFFGPLVAFVTESAVVAIHVLGTDAVAAVRRLVGPTDSNQARTEVPASLRARYGVDGTRNAVHASDSAAAAEREAAFFFGASSGMGGGTSAAARGGLPSGTSARRGEKTARLRDSTLCIVKPHCVAAQRTGAVVTALQRAGLVITAARTACFTRSQAEELLEVYQTVVFEFPEMVAELTAGLCVAFEVSGADAHAALRTLAGPADPELAQKLRPTSLRAIFGVDKVHNAVHCTDLPEDAPLEVGYVFELLGAE